MSPTDLAIALVVTFFAAAIQGVVGLGFAMVSVPILALIDPSLAPVPQLLTTIPLTVSMAWRERGHLQLSGIGWVLAGRVPGAVLGIALLAAATQRTLDLAIAAIVLLAVAIIASGVHVRRSPGVEFGAGILSGVGGFVAAIGGPPLALLYSRDAGPTIRANLAAIFTLGLLITLTARAASGNITAGDVRTAFVLFPALLAGYLLSLRVKDRVSQRLVRWSILVLSTLGASGLVIRALT
jgi:hypothetical protein